MQRRIMGKLGHEVSLLGFGAMRLPLLDSSDSKSIDFTETTRMIRAAIDGGVSYIDSAYVYHGGMSEVALAKALTDGYRERVFLATKSPTWMLKTPEDFDRYLEESLQRLETDCIDFYLQHSLSRDGWQQFKEMDLFQRGQAAKAAGKIRYFGFSFHDSHDVFQEILDAYPWDFCQIQYNYLDVDYQAGKAGLQAAAARGIPVIVMEPLRGGRLASGIPDEIGEMLSSMHPDRSPVEWAIRWLADQPGATVILSGMSTLEQVEQNVAITSSEELTVGCMSSEEQSLISEVASLWRKRIKVPCTECQYCSACPQGINIPELFSGYNSASMFDTWDQARKRYASLVGEKKDATVCIACGACESVCPQHIPIIETLKTIDKALH